MAAQLDAEMLEQLARHRAQRCAGGGLARGSALQHGARIAGLVLQAAAQIGVPWPRIGRHGQALDGVIAIEQLQSQRRPQGQPRPQARQHLHLIALQLHATAAPVAALTAC